MMTTGREDTLLDRIKRWLGLRSDDEADGDELPAWHFDTGFLDYTREKSKEYPRIDVIPTPDLGYQVQFTNNLYGHARTFDFATKKEADAYADAVAKHMGAKTLNGEAIVGNDS